MILMMALSIKILAILLCFGIIGLFFRKKYPLNKFVIIFVGFICIGFFANWVSTSYVSPITDQITITALGDQNKNALYDEVFLLGFTVDGQEYLIENATEGKWFWVDNKYCWRNETSSQQPDGTTRSITLEVPVGWDRALNYESDQYKGLFTVETIGGSTVTVDGYSEETSSVSFYIGRSSSQSLIFNQIRYLVVYVLILAAFLFITILCLRWYVTKNEKVTTWLRTHWSHLLYAAIAFAMLFVTFFYSNHYSLWFDELCQVEFSALANTMKETILADPHTPPLYNIIIYFWYRIAPYGERWLLLPSMMMTAVAVYFTGLCGERIKNKYVGITATILIAVNITTITGCGMELRPYSIMVMFTTIIFYEYLGRLRAEDGNNKFRLIRIGIWMALAGYSHYFGVIFCGALFLIDIVLYIKKKIKIISVISYVIAIILYLPWFYVLLHYNGVGTWQPVPVWDNIPQLLIQLSGNLVPIFNLLIFGIIILIVSTIYRIVRKTFVFTEDFLMLLPLLIMGIMIISVYIYAVYIAWRSTLWVNRYFFSLLPCVALISAMGMDLTFSFLKHKKDDYRLPITICICLTLFLWSSSIDSLESYTQQNFRGAANWLYSQGNYIYNDDTLILSSDTIWAVDGWNEYYLTRQGKRDDINVVSNRSIPEKELLYYTRIYVVTLHTKTLTDTQQSVLDDNYLIEEEHESYHIKVYVKKE